MTIAEIKQQLTIDRVLAHYGLKPNRNGMVCCPFHTDKTPSMKVYFDSHTVHCFSGNCAQTGKAIDVIDFIFYKENCSKHQAIIKAKELIGAIPFSWQVSKPTHNQEKSTPMKNYNEAFLQLRQAVGGSKKAVAYLKQRGLFDISLEIGFKDKSTGSKIISGMADCIIFPLKNAQGEIVSLYGRSLSDAKAQRHHYSKNRTGLYPGYPPPETKTLVLTESVIDAATVAKYTNYQVLALYGTNGLNEEHVEALRNCEQLQEVILFLDGDVAGSKATHKYSNELHALFPKLTISRVISIQDEDPNSLIQSHSPEVLNHLIADREKLFGEAECNEVPRIGAKLDVSNPEYIVYTSDLLQVVVLGGIALRPVDKMVVTLKISKMDSRNPLHQLRHRLDLYNDDLVDKLVQKTAEKLELSSREVQHTIAKLIGQLELHRMQRLEEQKPQKAEERALTPARERAAIGFLRRPELLKNTNELIGKSGVVGEVNNRLLMYLVFTSRLRNQPLHIVSLGASGTGKTYLQERVSALMPDTEKLEITALSENALYYLGKTELKHKLVLIEDLDGASQDGVLYAIRELQSKQRISKTVPLKDSKGNLKTITLHVEGPICLAGTTTRESLYEDNANRSLLIYLDNSKAQQEAIMAYQRKLSAGTIDKQKEEEAREFLRDVQCVLKNIEVRNPYAEQLALPETVFKPLRTNAHYLHFIEAITFYKQHQREVKTDSSTKQKYIETTLEDIEEANLLLKEVLLAKSDELTKACRTFLESLKLALKQNKRLSFYKSEVRTWMKINPNTLKRYLSELVKYGYVKVVGGNKYKTGYEYEIVSEEEYNKLKELLTNALDTALQNIKSGLSGYAGQ